MIGSVPFYNTFSQQGHIKITIYHKDIYNNTKYSILRITF